MFQVSIILGKFAKDHFFVKVVSNYLPELFQLP